MPVLGPTCSQPAKKSHQFCLFSLSHIYNLPPLLASLPLPHYCPGEYCLLADTSCSIPILSNSLPFMLSKTPSQCITPVLKILMCFPCTSRVTSQLTAMVYTAHPANKVSTLSTPPSHADAPAILTSLAQNGPKSPILSFLCMCTCRFLCCERQVPVSFF